MVKVDKLSPDIDRLTKRYPIERIEKQHKRGKLHVVERIKYFFDKGSFTELDFGDPNADVGVVTGKGLVNGRPVYLYAQDFTYKGGSVDLAHAKKIVHLIDEALNNRGIIVGMIDSGGARIEGGVDSLEGYAMIFRKIVEASGKVPQISLIMGPSAGGAVYSPALTDFICMVKGISYMFVNGPRVVRRVTGQDVSPEELGGPDIHLAISGVAHLLGSDEYEAMDKVKKLISFLPTSCRECPPHDMQEGNAGRIKEMELYSELVAKGESFDVRDIIGYLLDKESFLEIQDAYAQNIVVGFGRVDGMVVGIVANNRMHYEGRLDSRAGVKAARFISFCDAFSIPILTIVDTPGFLLGVEEEHRGMIRHVAKLLYAYANARVPMVSLIIGNAYGGGYIAVGSKNLGNRYVISWPTASLGVMRAEEAYEVLYGKHRDKCDPRHRQMFIEEYREKIEKPEAGYEKGYIDEIIDPTLTKSKVSLSLRKLIESYSCKCRRYGVSPT